MNQSSFLKIAYFEGVTQIIRESRLTPLDIELLEKYALNPGSAWNKIRGVFRGGSKAVIPEAEAAASKVVPGAEAAASKVVPGTVTPGVSTGQPHLQYYNRKVPPAKTTPVPPAKTTAATSGSAKLEAPQISAKPAFQAPGRIQGEGWLAYRGRVNAARKVHSTRAATPALAAKQEARTSREIAKSQTQAQKENIRRQSQAALAKEQEALRAAQAEQQAAVSSKAIPPRSAAPAAQAPSAAPETVNKATEQARNTAAAGTQQAAETSATGTVAGKAKAIEGAGAAEQVGAKAEENLAQRYEKARAALPEGARGQLGEVAREGATGALGMGATTLAPTAIGAGLGYAADGREGALMGAGLGLGARAGMGPLLKRMREARGLGKVLPGTAKELSGLHGLQNILKGGNIPTDQLMSSPVGQKSLIGAGLLGAGGAGLGYAAGQRLPPSEPEPWYSGGLGLDPNMMRGVSQAALPMLAQQYGLNPAALQALASQSGLMPPQMGASQY